MHRIKTHNTKHAGAWSHSCPTQQGGQDQRKGLPAARSPSPLDFIDAWPSHLPARSLCFLFQPLQTTPKSCPLIIPTTHSLHCLVIYTGGLGSRRLGGRLSTTRTAGSIISKKELKDCSPLRGPHRPRQTMAGSRRRPAAGALACCVLALGCAAWSSHAAFVSPLPSFAGGRGRGRAQAVVAERPSSTPSIYSAAAGQGEEDTQPPAAEAAGVAVEAKKKSPREEERKSKHFDFLKVCIAHGKGEGCKARTPPDTTISPC